MIRIKEWRAGESTSDLRNWNAIAINNNRSERKTDEKEREKYHQQQNTTESIEWFNSIGIGERPADYMGMT